MSVGGPAAPRIAVVTVAYDTGDLLVEGVRTTLEHHEPGSLEIVVVNNGGPGPELDAVRSLGATVVEAGGNVGFPAGCNLGARATSAPVIVFLNPDAAARDGALTTLADRLEADPTIGAAVSLICLADRPGLINSGGNVIHVSGMGWSAGFEQPVSTVPDVAEVTYTCGAAMAMRRDVFEEVGGFCEEYFLYHEDLELGWRLRLLGYRCVIDPASVVDHTYEFGRNARKFHYIERNRWIFLLTCFPARVLAAVLPVAVAFDIAIVALSIKEGWFGEKVEGWRWCVRHRRWLRERRRAVLATRRVEDAAVAGWLTDTIDPGMMALPAGIGLINRAVAGYWKLARRLL